MLARKPRMLVAVALANKMARAIWAMITYERDYQEPRGGSLLRRDATAAAQLSGQRGSADEPYGHVIEEGQPGASKEPRARPFCSGADPRIAIPASGMVNAAQQGLTHERCRSQLSRSRKTPYIHGGIHTGTPINLFASPSSS